MDPWIIVFAVIAVIALVGWIVNAMLWYRHPDDAALTKELQEQSREVERLITEVRDALAKVVAGLPEDTGSNGRTRSYGFYRTGSHD